MSRLKLPKPAKRKELMEKAAARGARENIGRYGMVKIGYAMALRHAHTSINESRRKSQRQRWNMTDFLNRERERKMSDPTTCPCKACTSNREATSQFTKEMENGTRCAHGRLNCNACGH